MNTTATPASTTVFEEPPEVKSCVVKNCNSVSTCEVELGNARDSKKDRAESAQKERFDNRYYDFMIGMCIREIENRTDWYKQHQPK